MTECRLDALHCACGTSERFRKKLRILLRFCDFFTMSLLPIIIPLKFEAWGGPLCTTGMYQLWWLLTRLQRLVSSASWWTFRLLMAHLFSVTLLARTYTHCLIVYKHMSRTSYTLFMYMCYVHYSILFTSIYYAPKLKQSFFFSVFPAFLKHYLVFLTIKFINLMTLFLNKRGLRWFQSELLNAQWRTEMA